MGVVFLSIDEASFSKHREALAWRTTNNQVDFSIPYDFTDFIGTNIVNIFYNQRYRRKVYSVRFCKTLVYFICHQYRETAVL